MTAPTRSTAHRGGPRHARRAPYGRTRVAVAAVLVVLFGLFAAALATAPTRDTHATPEAPVSRTWARTEPVAYVLAQSRTPIVCGDTGRATWGEGRICWQGDAWWVTWRDIKTDGYCVWAFSTNGNTDFGDACTSSWVTSQQMTGFRWARIGIGNPVVRYLTLDNA